jgi:hypothetical protein
MARQKEQDEKAKKRLQQRWASILRALRTTRGKRGEFGTAIAKAQESTTERALGDAAAVDVSAATEGDSGAKEAGWMSRVKSLVTPKAASKHVSFDDVDDSDLANMVNLSDAEVQAVFLAGYRGLRRR